jgi:hypothetical protein
LLPNTHVTARAAKFSKKAALRECNFITSNYIHIVIIILQRCFVAVFTAGKGVLVGA